MVSFKCILHISFILHLNGKAKCELTWELHLKQFNDNHEYLNTFKQYKWLHPYLLPASSCSVGDNIQERICQITIIIKGIVPSR